MNSIILNQFKVGLETDKGHFTLKVRTVDSGADVHFFWSQLYGLRATLNFTI
jgi:hypothetical protein